MKSKLPVKALLLIAAVIVILSMLRLAVWQLDRAEQKRQVLNVTRAQATLAAVDLNDLLAGFSESERFRQITVFGRYLPEKSIFLDNQVHHSKVGYHVVTPLQISGSKRVVLVNRGWVSVGQSRDVLPKIATVPERITVYGRLNMPAVQPPLWDDNYPVSKGQVWQYLPIGEYAQQMQLNVLPLVVELAPDSAGDSNLLREWSGIDDQWVAKHQGYAFQWFAMALAFFIACVVLLLRSTKQT